VQTLEKRKQTLRKMPLGELGLKIFDKTVKGGIHNVNTEIVP
jgi:hypothetical protein